MHLLFFTYTNNVVCLFIFFSCLTIQQLLEFLSCFLRRKNNSICNFSGSIYSLRPAHTQRLHPGVQKACCSPHRWSASPAWSPAPGSLGQANLVTPSCHCRCDTLPHQVRRYQDWCPQELNLQKGRYSDCYILVSLSEKWSHDRRYICAGTVLGG